MTDLLRILIVGHGLMGRRRAAAVRSLAASLPVMLAGVVEPDDAAAADVPEGVRWRDLSDVPYSVYDAAFICLPHHASHRATFDVVADDKLTLCEKPLGSNAEQARDVLRINPHRDPHFVGHNYRFLPHVSEAMHVALSGQLGELRSADVVIGHGGKPEDRSSWKNDPEQGGGVLLDLGCHAFDLLRLLRPDVRVTHAEASSGFWGVGDEDAGVTLRDGRFVGTVRVSTVRWVNTFRLEIWGEEGYAACEGRGGCYGPMRLRLGKRWAWMGGMEQRETERVIDFGGVDRSIEDETEAALRRWLGMDVPKLPASLEDGLAAVVLCDEARKIAGKRP